MGWSSRRTGAEPISIAGRPKRLRSLDEFEPPYWVGLFEAARGRGSRFWILVFAVAIVGSLIGWFAAPL